MSDARKGPQVMPSQWVLIVTLFSSSRGFVGPILRSEPRSAVYSICHSTSSSVASAICPTSPRGARFQLTRCWKGTKMKKLRDQRTVETVGVILNFFSIQLSLGRPRGQLEPAARQACPCHKVGVGMKRLDSPCHSMPPPVISRGGRWIANPWSYGTAQMWLLYNLAL
ncbi:hypothetical protein L3X38_042273 [Prunus dulcis]|uniref:Uncharacterized protein n=1 Tax=Prunus dulcis TaxID=3755 RepID=A0AAD4UVZ5_PRUDU|nr:hypothetical protein L3X38_042273 [Prunus dulcis]